MVEAAKARGVPAPEWLDEVPVLIDGDEFYLQAFNELSTCRQIGFGVGPIPWRDIIFFAEYARLDETMLPIFVRIIRAMDRVYLEWSDKKKPHGGVSNSSKDRLGRSPKRFKRRNA